MHVGPATTRVRSRTLIFDKKPEFFANFYSLYVLQTRQVSIYLIFSWVIKRWKIRQGGNLRDGVEILEEKVGSGPGVENGDLIHFFCSVSLDGRLVQERKSQKVWMGSRGIVPGVSKALIGMCSGGYRRVRVLPHLAFGTAKMPSRITAETVLEYEVWLESVHKTVAEL